MRLAFAFCADAAQMTPDGKVFVLGGDFDAIHAREFPAGHPMMSLVVKLAVQPTECQREHELRVDLIDSGGQAIHRPIKLGFRPEPNPQLLHKSVGVGFGSLARSNWRWPLPADPAVPISLIPMVGIQRRLRGQPPGPPEQRYSSQILGGIQVHSL